MNSDIYAVRFVLDGQIHEARSERRTTTVLDYVREKLHRTGTKEGCAEGDCGACVVLVGALADNDTRIEWKPVNSCMQMLPTLNGKAVKTVESLHRVNAQGATVLHPVQEAMVACHGSQCGFCTPGFVMSMAGFVETCATPPTRAQVTNALSGNLCRCTGYKPIIDATLKACQAPAAARSLQNPSELALLKSIAPSQEPHYNFEGEPITEPVVRTRKGNEFVAPVNVAELATYLAKHPDTYVLAGSTEFGLAVNKRFERPAFLAYVGNVAEMTRIAEDADAWHLGAAATLDRIELLFKSPLPDFAEVLRRFGSPPIRATATLGGNIANGSPIGDAMPCLMALGATLTLRRLNAKGKVEARHVSLDSFYTGMKKNVLQPGEFIETIHIPKLNSGSASSASRHFRAHKISKRFDQDISATCCAMAWRDDSGVLRDVRLAYNGLTPFPARALKLEQVLEGQRADQVTAEQLDAVIATSFTARDGLRATWTYRALVARNLVLRFVQPELQPVEA